MSKEKLIYYKKKLGESDFNSILDYLDMVNPRSGNRPSYVAIAVFHRIPTHTISRIAKLHRGPTQKPRNWLMLVKK